MMMVSVYEREDRILVNAFVIGTSGSAHTFSVHRDEFWAGMGMDAAESQSLDASRKNELTKCLTNRLRFVSGDQLKLNLSSSDAGPPTKIKTIVKRCSGKRLIATFFRKGDQLEINAYDQSTCSCSTTTLTAEDWESTGNGQLSDLDGAQITGLCNVISENMTILEAEGNEENAESRVFALVVTLGLSICGKGLGSSAAQHPKLGLDMPLWSTQLAVRVQQAAQPIDADQYPEEHRNAVDNILQNILLSNA
jgi:hypothetical protein